MRQLVKSVLRSVAPQWTEAHLARRTNAHRELVLAELGLPDLQRRVRERLGENVAAGPFAGLQLLNESRGSVNIPKLVGSYEEELHPVIKSLRTRRPGLILDVGCAEGYYAVGLARLLGGQTRVLAYDIDSVSRALCARMAEVNDVADAVEVRAECNHCELREVLLPTAFLLCDCEGYELDLLDPGQAPQLRAVEMLVELHDAFRPGIREAITGRFADSHEITLIDSRERDPAHYPAIGFLGDDERRRALSEFRSGLQTWAHLVPRAA